MTDLTPREIVSELDRFIIGQKEAKRAVAVALRNRWRRRQLDNAMQAEVYPKNILMIGPTGVGKTEISRRLAKLAQAPFIKVEATKFTEVGYVGRDVEQIIRDLIEVAINMLRDERREAVRDEAHLKAENRVIAALAGTDARPSTVEHFRERLRKGEFNDKEIEIDLRDNSNPFAMMDIPGQPNMGMGMMNLGDMFSGLGGRTKKRKVKVADSYKLLVDEEADKLIDDEGLTKEAVYAVENNGIVFIDEIDKVASSQNRQGADVSREGVQRDLLPFIEGTTVSTKYGAIKTDHILFIASGAFHVAKPSDLLPELQGRLPIRVNLRDLTADDFKRILTEPDNALTKQYQALMATENVKISFTDEGITALAEIAANVNRNVENIGARRLHTILEKLLDELSFTAPDQGGSDVVIDDAYVKEQLEDIAESQDLSRYML